MDRLRGHRASPRERSELDDRTYVLARANAELAEALAARTREENERKVMRRKLALAEEGERTRLARELHDQLGQHLTAITLGLHEVSEMVGPASRVRERVEALQALTALLTRDARYIAHDLRPAELDDFGLESAMLSHVSLWGKRYGIAAEFASTGMAGSGDKGVEAAMLYRVLQEALTNVAKHASATHVSVILEMTGEGAVMIVEDNGTGFDVDETVSRAASGEHIGLASMRERAALVEGSVTVESSPGKGTTIFARVPSL